jgi:hypothetical protein
MPKHVKGTLEAQIWEQYLDEFIRIAGESLEKAA